MLCRLSARALALAFVVLALLLGVAQRQAFAQSEASTDVASIAAAPGVAAPAVAAPAAAAPQEPPPTAQGSGGFFDEPGFLTSAITLANAFGERAEKPKSGFYPELAVYSLLLMVLGLLPVALLWKFARFGAEPERS